MTQFVMQFVVPGKPLTWQRASRGKYGPSYTPKDRETQMSVIRDAWRDLEVEPYERGVPLALGVVVFCKRPATHFRANGDLKDWAWAERPGRGENGGDLDNFVKLVKDALSNVAYDDDAQIAEFQRVTIGDFEYPTGKFYVEPGAMPRTVVALALAPLPPGAPAALL